MFDIPRNMKLLHQGEEELHERSIALIASHRDLSDHLALVERAMDVLDVLRQHHQSNDDERTVSHLAIRCFNHFAGSWKLTASGYYQAAALLLRDVVETTYLINAFYLDPTHIAIWRTADRKTKKALFSPATVRKRLDADMGAARSRCEQIYATFSSLAGHPSVEGFAMLRPMGMDAHNGPFLDPTALRALLEELGKLAVQTGHAFCAFLDLSNPAAAQVAHRFIAFAMDYSGLYLGHPYTNEDRAEVDRLYSEIAQT